MKLREALLKAFCHVDGSLPTSYDQTLVDAGEGDAKAAAALKVHAHYADMIIRPLAAALHMTPAELSDLDVPL